MSAEQDTPHYELLAPCYMVIADPDTGMVGPTLCDTGYEFASHAIPCDAWHPKNEAARQKLDEWHRSLPLGGAVGVQIEDLTEAAHMMRPREGDPAVDHRAWSGQVVALALELAKKRQRQRTVTQPAMPLSRSKDMPVMPYAATSIGYPIDPGTPLPGKVFVPPAKTPARSIKPKPAMPNMPAGGALSQTAG